MKIIFKYFMVFALLLSLAGCSAKEEGASATDNAATTAPKDAEAQEKTASELAEIVLNSVEFPQTVNVTDKDIIDGMGIALSLTEEYAVIQQMLSVDVAEIIILKIKDGNNIEQAVDSLQKRKDSLIHDFAFYPGQIESAEATVVGSKGKIAYLICHKDADIAEEKLLKEIS